MIHRFRFRTAAGRGGSFGATRVSPRFATAPALPDGAAVVAAAIAPTASASGTITTRSRFIQPLLVRLWTALRARDPAAACAAGTAAFVLASDGREPPLAPPPRRFSPRP